MKSYLSLIPISAKVRKRQNLMTILCIVLAVFLVTAIFSMADMGIRAEEASLRMKHGYWHVKIKDISESEAEQIRLRPDVAVISWHDTINYERDFEYYIGGRTAVFIGVDEGYITNIMDCLEEGYYPHNDTEIMLSPNAKKILGIDIGDNITVNTPARDIEYTVSGFGEDDTSYNTLYGTIRAYMNRDAFQNLCDMNENALTPAYYVQFQKDAGASKRIEEIKEQYELTDNSIERNKAILDITGINDDSAMQPFYLAAAILFLLVLIAGVLMIASSMNSDIAQRTQFFGMMRCIGMSKRQILHFVRLEALNWCKTAVPIGLALGVVSTWGLCAVMRYGVGEEFLYMPLFKISAVGIISGAVTGIVTVFIAAKSPAKQASKVSPVSAVSGNAVKARGVHRAVNIPFKKIETSLGIQRALSAKKNLLLMTGSFALSIILFLSFSVLIELVNYLMPQKANYSDIEIYSVDNINSLDSTLIHKISDMDGVKEVFGRRSIFDIPAELLSNTISADTVDLISFDEFDLDCLTKDKELRKGSDISKVYGNSNYVISIHDKEGSLKIGDKVRIGDEELEVAGLLRYDIFTNDGSTDGRVTLITSGETFTRLTNVSDYSLISIQLTKDVTDGDVEAIRSLLGDECKFRDYRDQRTIGTYTAFVVLVYAFVVLIALVAILNIVNSISMSVSARIKQYGVMRAIGADKHQVMRMITAEASTYAFSGFVIGCVVGVPLSKLMYDKLITAHFSYATWNVPVQSLLIILIFIILSTIAAVYVPSKRMSNMPITEIISEL
ncbi:ABC transporter permease [Acetivibrio mesophilus]|nr:ABC transporter permease [Acetivibrio mesophilus]ODM26359.1 hypothetical protein A7W90_09070 [Clostridium sp. Bc-iso-3]